MTIAVHCPDFWCLYVIVHLSFVVCRLSFYRTSLVATVVCVFHGGEIFTSSPSFFCSLWTAFVISWYWARVRRANSFCPVRWYAWDSWKCRLPSSSEESPSFR